MDSVKPDLVLEFVIHHLTIKNLSAKRSPLYIAFPHTTPIFIEPSAVSFSSITYEKGKRLFFRWSNIVNLTADIELRSGQGRETKRGACQIDFLKLCGGPDLLGKSMYEAQVCLEEASGKPIGILYLSAQLLSFDDFHAIKK